MRATGATGRKLDEVLSTLSSLKGVRRAFFLDDDMRSGLARVEKEYPSLGPLVVRNDGVRECLKREHVACVIKDRHFRPPPIPTVVLVDEDGTVIGKEVLPGEKIATGPGTKAFMLGKDFVVFYEKGKGKGARFVLPPVPFKEAEGIAGLRRVCSSSPSTAGDFLLRECMALDDDPKLASVLVAFDLG